MGRRAILLDEDEVPRSWYNALPDLPKRLPPPIDPATREPMSPSKLEALFPREVVRQEVSSDRWVPIPEELREVYLMWRPTPLIRARRLEERLKTPAKIYYKYEGVSPTGSHKPNTAVAQAYYAMREGVERLTTETGAGQWGSALAFSCDVFGLRSTIYMVKVSYHQKPYRRVLMELWGAEVIPSPSERTKFGREVLKREPDSPGSLGIAISEAIEDALTHDDAKYALGSVLNFVLTHQTVVGLEAKRQLELVDEYPDYVVGCVGGGSNFSGLFLPFYHDVASGRASGVRFVAAESTACPSLTKGTYLYDYGDTAKLTPLLAMYTLGHDFMPAPIHAGGLRYHGAAPILSLLVSEGVVESVAYDQVSVFEAARLFARTEGIVPAPESAHAVKAVVDIALRARERGEEATILFNLSGHGLLDLKAYEEFLSGKLEPYHYPREEVERNIGRLMAELKELGVPPPSQLTG